MMRKYYEEKEKGGAMKYIVPFLCVIVLIAVFAGIFYLRGKQDKKKAEDTKTVVETESETENLTGKLQDALTTEQEALVSIDNLNEYV